MPGQELPQHELLRQYWFLKLGACLLESQSERSACLLLELSPKYYSSPLFLQREGFSEIEKGSYSPLFPHYTLQQRCKDQLEGTKKMLLLFYHNDAHLISASFLIVSELITEVNYQLLIRQIPHQLFLYLQ